MNFTINIIQAQNTSTFDITNVHGLNKAANLHLCTCLRGFQYNQQLSSQNEQQNRHKIMKNLTYADPY